MNPTSRENTAFSYAIVSENQSNLIFGAELFQTNQIDLNEDTKAENLFSLFTKYFSSQHITTDHNGGIAQHNTEQFNTTKIGVSSISPMLRFSKFFVRDEITNLKTASRQTMMKPITGLPVKTENPPDSFVSKLTTSGGFSFFCLGLRWN